MIDEEKEGKGPMVGKRMGDIVLYNYMPRKERMVSYIKLIVKNAKGRSQEGRIRKTG
jgi:hypothetical protein